ncbi:MAG: nuclease-related domain-containing protein [Streptosporangiaceae bacterium]
MDHETGPDTAPIGRVVPGRDPAIPEPNRPSPGGRSPWPADLARPAPIEPPEPAGPGLLADPRVPVWIRRTILALIAGGAVTLWQDWRWGLTAAAVVAIADTVYQSKAMSPIPADVRALSARRRTRHRLAMLRAAGYLALHERAIPGTDSIIDHLVIGPAGVYAVDSERWDRRLPVRTTAGGQNASGVLYHGPFSQSPRLAHARWEAAMAASLIGAELGQEINVSAVMVIYGPTVPWGVATLRDVDVFSGSRIRKFFRRQKRRARGHRLGAEEIDEIYAAAEQALPPAD